MVVVVVAVAVAVVVAEASAETSSLLNQYENPEEESEYKNFF